jgi:hypothetical protein
VDVTKDVSGLSRDVGPQLEDIFSVIRRRHEPDIQIGPHCSAPYAGPLTDRCWNFLPPGNVLDLYYGGKKCRRLLAEGIVRLGDVPDRVELTDRQAIQRKTALTGQPHIDHKALASFLKRLRYPVSYLDFETFGTAIPLFDGLSPPTSRPATEEGSASAGRGPRRRLLGSLGRFRKVGGTVSQMPFWSTGSAK